MRLVFVGASNLTVRTAELLIERGHEVIIIDSDKDRLEELSDELDCSFLLGDGSTPHVLEQADPPECAVLFALSGDDQDNIVAALAARTLGFARVVPHITDPQFEYICKELGLEDVIIPDRTIAHYLADSAEGIDVQDIAAAIKDDARLFTFSLAEDQAGKAGDLDLPEQSRIIAIYREGSFQLVDASTELKKGDEVLVIAHQKAIEGLKEKWHGSG